MFRTQEITIKDSLHNETTVLIVWLQAYNDIIYWEKWCFCPVQKFNCDFTPIFSTLWFYPRYFKMKEPLAPGPGSLQLQWSTRSTATAGPWYPLLVRQRCSDRSQAAACRLAFQPICRRLDWKSVPPASSARPRLPSPCRFWIVRSHTQSTPLLSCVPLVAQTLDVGLLKV
jgi:hypothetical protein